LITGTSNVDSTAISPGQRRWTSREHIALRDFPIAAAAPTQPTVPITKSINQTRSDGYAYLFKRKPGSKPGW
jgi:hypothetical protein